MRSDLKEGSLTYQAEVDGEYWVLIKFKHGVVARKTNGKGYQSHGAKFANLAGARIPRHVTSSSYAHLACPPSTTWLSPHEWQRTVLPSPPIP